MSSRVHDVNPAFRRRRSAPSGATEGTTMAGAIVGGTIGAFTGGPLATVAGMAIGAVAARQLSAYVRATESDPPDEQAAGA